MVGFLFKVEVIIVTEFSMADTVYDSKSKFFTLFSLVARQTLAYWFIDPDDALSSILTVKIITGAGTGETHGRRKLTEQATAE